MILTLQQMLGRWRTAQGYEPARLDCSAEVFEGWDVTERLTGEVRRWYLELLDTAPERYLCPRDISADLRLTDVGAGVRTALLSPSVRRVLSMTVRGAGAPVRVVSTDSGAAAADDLRRLTTRARNPYTAGSAANPVALVSGRRLWLWCGDVDPLVTEVRAVVDPGDETFEFDESALALIPTC